MSSLTKVLAEEVRKIEETAAVGRAMQTNRLTHHLMPPTGWLNDPNGLCWYKGRYHVFFQYSPFESNGGLKFWGHYSSEDMISWRYEGVPLLPDSIYDCHGVYSGSAIAEKDKLHLSTQETSRWMEIMIISITEGSPALSMWRVRTRSFWNKRSSRFLGGLSEELHMPHP